MAKAKRCQFRGPGGENVDANGWCLNDATRKTNALAEDSFSLCPEHDKFVKAYFLAQAAARQPMES